MSLSVDILLCTFRRAHVAQTIASLDAPPGVALRLIVADNDETDSARETVAAAARARGLAHLYLHAPARNISLARNACLAAARADWVAFIDDDEEAAPGWLAALLERACETGADAVFGPALARYGPGAPGWTAALDLHSNRPVRRRGRIETGHTCNALLRWAGTPWQAERFDLARGRSGGEDTEFFFRLARIGARYEDAPRAIVHEDVAPGRLSLRWLGARRFRMGQSHAAAATGPAARAALFLAAALKAAACWAAALAAGPERRIFWRLRGALHRGVCAGCLGWPQRPLHG